MSAPLSDYDWGVYVIGMYSQEQNVSQADTVAAYKSRYGGDDAVSAIGKMARSVNVGALQSQMIDLAHENPGSTALAQADVNQILLNLGATLPPVSTIAAQAVAQTTTQVVDAAETTATVAFSGVKYLTAAVVVLGLCYLLFEGKELTKLL